MAKAADEFVVSWEMDGDRPVRATLTVGEDSREADVPQWPPAGWPLTSSGSLADLVEEARREAPDFAKRLHADLQRLGRPLWDSLFPGEVGEAIGAAISDVGVHRLVLATDDEYLLSLPVEAAIPSEGAVGIGCDTRLEVVRRLSGPEPPEQLPAGPLRIVVAVESPDEDKATGSVLDYEAEEWMLLNALDRLMGDGRAFVEFLDEGCLRSVLEAARDIQPQVLHVSGHGAPGGMVFEGPNGEEVPVPASALAQALGACESLRLLVTSACLTGVEASARGATLEPAVARALVRAGFPAVLAMQASVGDQFATRFLGQFYEALGGGATPSEAISRARQALGGVEAGEDAAGEWAIPVLYEGPEWGALFDEGRKWLPPAREAWTGWRGVSYKRRGEFVGRRDEKRRALRALRSHDGVGVIWHGLGGVGKSAFSTHLAERLMQRDGYRPVVVTGEHTPATLMEAVQDRLELWERDERDRARRDVLRSWGRDLRPEGDLDEDARWRRLKERVLAEEPVVFVLDNFEDNLRDVPTRAQPDASMRAAPRRRFGLKDEELDMRLRALVSGQTRARFLFTSRYPFGFGEDGRLCGLEEDHLGPLSPAEARKLMHHLPQLRGLTLEQKQQAFRTVGGHPRCLEYLDALLGGERQWPAEAPGLRAALEEKVARAKLDAEEWDRALAETVAVAMEDILLERLLQRVAASPARGLLDRMAVFRRPVDGFALELVAEREVSDEELETLEGLTLLWHEDDEYMVPQVTASALLQAQQGDELRTAHARAAAYWEHRFWNFSGALEDGMEARHHLLEVGQRKEAHAMALAAESFLFKRGYVREAEALARETYDLAKADALLEPHAEAACRLGRLAQQRGDVPEAIRRYEESRALCVAAGDRRGEGNAVGNLGVAWGGLGETGKAIEYHQQALRISRRMGDRRAEGNDLGNLGGAYAELGDVRKAIEYYEQALAIGREIGDRDAESRNLGNLGVAYAELGDAPKAIRYHEQALEISRETGDRYGEGADLGNLGGACERLGDVRRAIEYYEQALIVRREIGDRRGEGIDLGNLGNACARLGEARKAMEYYEQAVVIAREIGDRQGECAHLGNLGSELRTVGEVDRARACLEEGLRLALAARDPLRATQLAWLLRHVPADQGDLATAVALAAFAFSRFGAMQYPQAEHAARSLARYRQEMGEGAFGEALARAEQVVGELFRRLAGEAGAEMARPLDVSPEDIEAALGERGEGGLRDMSTDDLERLVEQAEGDESPEDAEGVRWAVAQEMLRRMMPARAVPLLERSLEYERQRGDARSLGMTALGLTVALGASGNVEKARAVAEEALEAAEEAGEEELAGKARELLEALRSEGED